MFDDEKDNKTSGGMFGEAENKEKPVVHKRMFGEDERAHNMTPRKQKIIGILVVIAIVIIAVVWLALSVKWRHDATQYMIHH